MKLCLVLEKLQRLSASMACVLVRSDDDDWIEAMVTITGVHVERVYLDADSDLAPVIFRFGIDAVAEELVRVVNEELDRRL